MDLDPGFEESLREALLNDVEAKLAGEEGNLLHQAIQQAHEKLEWYGDQLDYDVQPIIDSLQYDVERDADSVTVRMGWEHPAAPYFEFGTSDHTVDGDPVLSFVWDKDDAPRWVKKEFEREGDGYRVFFSSVDVSGIPESRFVRDGLHWLRREVQA